MFRYPPETYHVDAHATLGVCGNLSVLWRHFGSPMPAPVPFPWAELEHYRVTL